MKKLLDREPTEEMVAAAGKHYESDEFRGVGSTFKAMFDAAPELTVDMEPVAWMFDWLNESHVQLTNPLKSYKTGFFMPKKVTPIYSATQLAALQAENERLEAKIKLAFDEDNKMAALLEQEQEVIKLTAERDELLTICKEGYEFMGACGMEDSIFAEHVQEAIAKHEGEKHD